MKLREIVWFDIKWIEGGGGNFKEDNGGVIRCDGDICRIGFWYVIFSLGRNCF